VTTPNNHVLIDYENVQPDLAERLKACHFKVWVFVGALQSKVKFDLVDLLQAKASDAKVIKMGGTGPNALDFHMAYHLGRLCLQDPGAYFHVIAKDKGLDPLLGQLQKDGLQAHRWDAVTDIPLFKPPASATEDEKLSRVIEYLIDRGRQRPASMKTLQGSIAALFQPKLGEAEIKAIVERLLATGVAANDGKKLRYGLPDD
jgi:hypothetical protein